MMKKCVIQMPQRHNLFFWCVYGGQMRQDNVLGIIETKSRRTSMHKVVTTEGCEEMRYGSPKWWLKMDLLVMYLNRRCLYCEA